MPYIKLEVSNCLECPFNDKRRHYTGDSWEIAYNWYCSKMDGKKIAGYVEWHEVDDVPIPDWCPVKIDE